LVFSHKGFRIGHTHKTGEIHFSRKEIKNKTTRNIYFVGNYDWDKGQSHNKIKIMEIDPGKDGETTVKLISSVKPEGSNVTITSEFETKIKKNNPDDEIMEQVIPRTAMFTVQTKIDDNHYQKSFSESGVTVNVKITGIDGLEF
jgi:L-lysine 2,3-aminomutase